MQPGFIPRMTSSSTPVLRPFTLTPFPPSLTAFQLRFISIIFHIQCPGVPLLCVFIPLRQMLISVLRLAQLLSVQQISAADRSPVCFLAALHVCTCACRLAFMCAVGGLPVALWHGCWCLLSLEFTCGFCLFATWNFLSFFFCKGTIPQYLCNFRPKNWSSWCVIWYWNKNLMWRNVRGVSDRINTAVPS